MNMATICDLTLVGFDKKDVQAVAKEYGLKNYRRAGFIPRLKPSADDIFYRAVSYDKFDPASAGNQPTELYILNDESRGAEPSANVQNNGELIAIRDPSVPILVYNKETQQLYKRQKNRQFIPIEDRIGTLT